MGRRRTVARIVAPACFAALVCAAVPSARISGQEVVLTDTLLVLTQRLPGAANDLTRSVGVRFADVSDADEIEFVPGDLTLDEPRPGGPLIDRSNVMATLPELRDGGPYDLVIQFSNVREPGTYSGTFELRLRDGGGAPRASARGRIRLDVLPSAELELRMPDEGFQRINCRSLGCLPARWLIHEAATRDSVRLWVEHVSPVDVKVTGVEAVLFGSQSRTLRPLPTLDVDIDVPPSGAALDYPWAPGSTPPDSYRGDLLITIEGVAQPVRRAFRMDVRAGPSIMLALLVLGVLLARSLAPVGSESTSNKHRWLVWTAGVAWPEGGSTRERREWGGRALAIAVLLLALLTAGVDQVYVNDTTFGDQIVLDHLKVFLWPFTADVMVRGLGNIKWPKRTSAASTSEAPDSDS